MKSLEDAKNGLLRYWKLRPNGGTRTELINLATIEGFVEPLLNEWLDVFLQGFVDTGHIDTPDYDALTARLREVGYDRASRAVDGMFKYLTGTGAALWKIRNENRAQELQQALAVTQNELVALDAATTQVTNKLTGDAKTAALVAINEAQIKRNVVIARYQAQIDALLGISNEPDE